MRNHRRRSSVTVGMLAAGAILLAACNNSTQTDEAGQPEDLPTASSAVTTPEEVGNPGEAIQGEPMDTETTADATDQERPFFVQDASISLGYPVETSSVLSDVDGDIPADQYTITWGFQNEPNADGAMEPYRRYNLNPNVDFNVTPVSVGDYRLLCIDRSDGYGGRCTGFPSGLPISLDGQYELYLQEFGPGGQDDPVEGTKEVLGSFVYTAPKFEEPLAPPLCELTGGTAVLDGDNYVVTVDHVGECSPDQTWLSNVQVINDMSGLPVKIFGPSNISEASHTESQTVLVIPQEELKPWFDYGDVNPDDLNAFQVMSGSNEPGYSPSTIRIALEQ